MNEARKMDETEKETSELDVVDDLPHEQRAADSTVAERGITQRVRKLFTDFQRRGTVTKRDLAKDRTRSLALLIVGVVGAGLLFIGLFSTPSSMPPSREATPRGTPNLGRRGAPGEAAGPRSSVTPLLSADVQTSDGSGQELSPSDIQATSRRSEADKPADSADEHADLRSSRSAVLPPKKSDQIPLPPTASSDPLAAYRLNTRTGTGTYSYGGPSTTAAPVDSPRVFSYGPSAGTSVDVRSDSPVSMKSSIVFVRAAEWPDRTGVVGTARPGISEQSLLAPGARLLVRLESDATTAVKMLVVAAVEYNYERDGVVIVPAGAKVFGGIQQASSDGYVKMQFHTLQMPNGREEKIEGAAVGLDQKPLKAEVSGKKTGKKVLSRTLSGVSTIAAYVVGGGAGLSRSITGESLLRDRIAGNIALAGEQELMNAAYSQNITVTVPANTKFYVVLQKAAVNTTAPSSARSAESPARPAEIPTAQELRELMDLRREINRMYQESNSNWSTTAKPQN